MANCQFEKFKYKSKEFICSRIDLIFHKLFNLINKKSKDKKIKHLKSNLLIIGSRSWPNIAIVLFIFFRIYLRKTNTFRNLSKNSFNFSNF